MEHLDDLESAFTEAAAAIVNAGANLDTSTMLQLYGLYKQATQGPCNTSKPSLFQFTARSKWDAWNSLGPMSKAEAMSSYVRLVNKLIGSAEQCGPKTSTMGVSVSCLARTEPEIEDDEKTIFDWLKDGQLEQVKSLIKTSPIVNEPDEGGMNLIHWAADRGDLSMLKLLLDNKADINSVDSTGQTALHYAYACGHQNCVEFLLKCGADANIRDFDGNLPTDLAES